jgi:trans-2,3-dihydro-3-hydroxyanthranilate isomerase
MNLPVFEQFLSMHGNAAKVTFLFCPEAVEEGNHIHARMFADLFGVGEDPATGSANTCLAAYMAKYKYLGSADVNAHVEQGYEIDRPSLMNIKASVENDHYNIQVGGKCILTAEGKLV